MSAPASAWWRARLTTTSERCWSAKRGTWICRCARAEASHRRALRLGPAQMLIEPRHGFNEVARPITIVELVHQDLVPSVAARARRARQTENIGRPGYAGGGSRLDRRGPDLGVA